MNLSFDDIENPQDVKALAVIGNFVLGRDSDPEDVLTTLEYVFDMGAEALEEGVDALDGSQEISKQRIVATIRFWFDYKR